MDTLLINYMHSQLDMVDNRFHRYLYNQLNWQSRMIGIVGPRGIGKTTMLLQYIKEHIDNERCLYVSLDNMYFSSHSLVELADDFVIDGGEHLFIDEIHKYDNWSRELKQIYDTHPDLKVLFTGSSILDIYRGAADLSRRAPIFYLQGLSFREYLHLREGITAPVYSLEEILSLKVQLPSIKHPLAFFRQYLRDGYYPFGDDNNFFIEIRQIINQTMEVDIPTYANMNASTGRKLKQLLAIVAESVPFKPVMQNLASLLSISRNNVADYLMYIEKAGMISQVRDSTGGIRGLGKVEKIYLDNTNIIYSLVGEKADLGNLRETFFFNQMRVNNDVIVSKVSDFEIGSMTFEIGGKSKKQRQVATVDKGYVVKDDIEYGTGNVIPLWHFGFNY